ncbi:isoleucine--tRNA ligase [Candidatus Pacearchaeota archaeon]|nr:isoleucine--tRNA ligase [Candidatus Pacearchaeota archaeon]
MVSVEEIEKKILEFWEKNNIFKKSLDKTKKAKPYIFYDGPPFATGLPHYGHILASVLKDVFPRFFTMNGKYVKRRWGWDCHGLPIENIAEKELGINSKDEIEKMGVKKFNDFCRSKVLTYVSEWKKTVDRIGRWVEFDNSYKTMDNEYIESVWWAFKQLYDKGFIYEGEKVLMYCPRCSTPLAKSEITMDNSYKIIKDTTLVVKFKLKDEDVYALAWTTTPWTLPSNLALTINPDLTYSYVKDNESKETYVLAKKLLSQFYKSPAEYEIIKEVKGQTLEGKRYEPLFDYFKDTENAFKFLLADFVTAEEGTGIVHTAPAFGEEDNVVCRKYKIPMVQPVDEKGHFTEEVKDFANQYIFDANLEIVKFLKIKNKAVMSRKMEHEYPFCYRCETPLMYRALPAWFVDIQKIKKKLLTLNKKINWIPKFLKEGRVKHNLETAPDWNISRNRYWASAIPVWKSETGKIKVIGSIKELEKYAKNSSGKIDLHKDYLDKIVFEIKGEKYQRVPEVLDCWFESGSMPFAQFHYPFENKKFFEDNFPSQFVAEYIGQTRAWFYYMMALSAILFEKIPFENVLTTGTILAGDGEKMSKSKNNFPDPKEILEKYGADALRFYLLQSSLMNADNLNFSEKGVEEIYKKVILLLYNVNNFYSEYKTEKKLGKEKLEIIDKWILSRLEEVGLNVTENMKSYNTIKACDGLRNFIDDLSTWYVRINRERFNEEDKLAPKVLKEILEKLSKLIAPIMPFISEKIYQTIYSEEDSVHLENWPKFDKKKISKKLIKDMEEVREIVSLGLKERDKEQIGLKWPLANATIYSNKKFDKEFLDIVLKQLNVKELILKDEEETKVELNIQLTPELEAEGYAREMSRQVQSFRKKLGLEKKDEIELLIFTDEKFKKILEKQKEFIEERTNSKKLNILENVTTDKERFKNRNEFKIKDKKGEIIINF